MRVVLLGGAMAANIITHEPGGFATAAHPLPDAAGVSQVRGGV